MAGNEKLGLADGPDRYGMLSRAFHWGLAALILFQILGRLLAEALGEESAVSHAIVTSHVPLGALILVLSLARLAWALAMRRRRPEGEPGVQGLIAKAVHGLLYLMMIVVPGAALLRAWGNPWGLNILGVQVFAPRDGRVFWALSVGGWHGVLALMFLGLIGMHVGAALFHRIVKRDGVMRRMAG